MAHVPIRIVTVGPTRSIRTLSTLASWKVGQWPYRSVTFEVPTISFGTASSPWGMSALPLGGQFVTVTALSNFWSGGVPALARIGGLLDGVWFDPLLLPIPD